MNLILSINNAIIHPKAFILLVVVFFSCFQVFAQKCQNDSIPPILQLNTSDTICHPVNTKYKRVQPTAVDDCSDSALISLDLTSNVNPYVIGMYTDRYGATDEAGNKQLAIRYVKVVDDEKPIITSRYGNQLTFPQGQTMKNSWSDYLILTDNYEVPETLLQNLVAFDNNINFNRVGYYHISFRTHDNSGNVSDVLALDIFVTGSNFGIHTEQSKSLNIFPNPSNGTFSLSLVEVLTEPLLLVEILDAFGKSIQVMQFLGKDTNLLEIEMTDQAKGIYFIRATTPSLTITRPLILQ